jgi:micrococcal nuclease
MMRRITTSALIVAAAALLISGCGDAQPAITDTSNMSNEDAVTSVVDGELARFLLSTGRRVIVERVIDGDTVVVSGGERVRLLTVDAPELRSQTKVDDADPCAEQSRDDLAVLLPPGTEVILNGLKGEPDTDRFERTLANLYLPTDGGQLLNVSLVLVGQGDARVYIDYPTADSDDALRLEESARARTLGVWGKCPE